MYFVYFLKSIKNKKTYVGVTEKLPIKRLKEHNIGTNKWTRNNRPFDLKYFEQYFCKTDAIKRERFYKTGFGRKIRDILIREIQI